MATLHVLNSRKLFKKFSQYMQIHYFIKLVFLIPSYVIGFVLLMLIRAIKPIFLIRIGGLRSSRIGHFAANTELYLCEKKSSINVPKQLHLDIFFFEERPLCNKQLAKMWRRVLYVGPAWLFSPLSRLNKMFPGGAIHEIGDNSKGDRDVHNLYEKFSTHLLFSENEERHGSARLREMGIPEDGRFVCLIVRDEVYLNSHIKNDWSYHNYRDSPIEDYTLAALELSRRGYYVIRMGAKVKRPIAINEEKIIDYATNGMRSDFMDIYLGSKCFFCVSTGAGWDAVPQIFRKPIVYVNYVPLGYMCTYRNSALSIFKHHIDRNSGRELCLNEIFNVGAGFLVKSSDYDDKSIELKNNTPEEICEAVMEMTDRLNGNYQASLHDEFLQSQFLDIFSRNVNNDDYGKTLHGKIKSKVGGPFKNKNWLSSNTYD